MKPKIMIVDDNEMMKQFLNVVLQPIGVIYPYTSSKAALDIIESGLRPDIILLDIEMPEIRGDVFLGRLRAKGILDRTKVIILSGKNKSDIKIKCLEYGAADYISKPFHPKELKLRVQNHIDTNYLAKASA